MAKSEGQVRSRKQEQRITRSLKEIGMQARTQMASGSLWFAKSDVVSDLFQIEAKTRAKASKTMSIKKEWMDKIGQEAFEEGKLPALAFSFGDSTDYFVLKDQDFLALIEELIELRKRGEQDA
ncbi:hypothetical protein [Peribacillus frigoritolerans]|uniref:Holliday junction resolvase n=1 Tax=Peribacillus castrilensis TaxID=2897690 RepID=A0AAW9NJF7_9BACI|nr:hypothetical protein [Peribacillus castrilensis]